MSAVLERVKKNTTDLPKKVAGELETGSLSRLLRRETWSEHEKAENSPFEVALVRGNISREAYTDLLAQVYPVYCALEERAGALRDDPIAGHVIVDDLNRKPFLEEDLAYYAGDTWRSIELLPVTREYVDRVRTVPPLRYVAHHYNRYLADLSGGLMIRDGLKKAWNLNGEGLRYYEFPGIPDPTAFKDAYRGTLDELPLSVAQKLELIEEVMVAYEFNIEMVRALGERHLGA
jgi:heme oxygenase